MQLCKWTQIFYFWSLSGSISQATAEWIHSVYEVEVLCIWDGQRSCAGVLCWIPPSERHGFIQSREQTKIELFFTLNIKVILKGDLHPGLFGEKWSTVHWLCNGWMDLLCKWENKLCKWIICAVAQMVRFHIWTSCLLAHLCKRTNKSSSLQGRWYHVGCPSSSNIPCWRNTQWKVPKHMSVSVPWLLWWNLLWGTLITKVEISVSGS